MNSDLAPMQVSGGFQVSNTLPYTILARIPRNAKSPACLSVLNTHVSAIMYLKWIPLEQTGQNFATADAAIVLGGTNPRAYTWDDPPRGAMLIAQTDTNGAIAAVDGRWFVPQEADLI